MRGYSILSIILLITLVNQPGVSFADSEDGNRFTNCLNELKTQALDQFGNTSEQAPQVIERMYQQIVELPQVVAADRKQPEFSQTFQAYYERRVTDARVERGRQLAREQAQLFADLNDTYAVHPSYLVALWGLETNFGGYMGKLAMPSALATLACDARRAQFFTAQLLAATEIAVRGDIDPETMVGSWAGAMGHMQFMPTTYLEHAVDYEGDGRADVYTSLGDAMASASNYLKNAGWQSGYRWGREVLLPKNFDYSEAHRGNWQPLNYWHELGVLNTNGSKVAALDLASAIILPAGHQGPAFLVYENFNVIMKWNRSVNYAIAVGRLADRIAGLGKLATPFPPPSVAQFRTIDLVNLQTALTQQGFDTNGADGVLGPATRNAIRNFQIKRGLPADGFPSSGVFQALNLDH